MTKGKIVLVPFPFDDLSSNKVRPAVCLTDPIGSRNHIVIAFISSTISSDILNTDMIIHANQAGFDSTGLRTSSTIRLHRLMTVNKSIIQRELGKLTSKMEEDLNKKLKLVFMLD
jgi:mRNA interferase MazF